MIRQPAVALEHLFQCCLSWLRFGNQAPCRFFGGAVTESLASSHEVSSLTEPLLEEAWDEPGDVAQLVEHYNLETKVAGRTSGTTLFVVESKRRDGRLVDCDPDQQFKLFLVASSVVRLFIEKSFIVWRNLCLIPQHVVISMQWLHNQVVTHAILRWHTWTLRFRCQSFSWAMELQGFWRRTSTLPWKGKESKAIAFGSWLDVSLLTAFVALRCFEHVATFSFHG